MSKTTKNVSIASLQIEIDRLQKERLDIIKDRRIMTINVLEQKQLITRALSTASDSVPMCNMENFVGDITDCCKAFVEDIERIKAKHID